MPGGAARRASRPPGLRSMSAGEERSFCAKFPKTERPACYQRIPFACRLRAACVPLVSRSARPGPRLALRARGHRAALARVARSGLAGPPLPALRVARRCRSLRSRARLRAASRGRFGLPPAAAVAPRRPPERAAPLRRPLRAPLRSAPAVPLPRLAARTAPAAAPLRWRSAPGSAPLRPPTRRRPRRRGPLARVSPAARGPRPPAGLRPSGRERCPLVGFAVRSARGAPPPLPRRWLVGPPKTDGGPPSIADAPLPRAHTRGGRGGTPPPGLPPCYGSHLARAPRPLRPGPPGSPSGFAPWGPRPSPCGRRAPHCAPPPGSARRPPAPPGASSWREVAPPPRRRGGGGARTSARRPASLGGLARGASSAPARACSLPPQWPSALIDGLPPSTTAGAYSRGPRRGRACGARALVAARRGGRAGPPPPGTAPATWAAPAAARLLPRAVPASRGPRPAASLRRWLRFAPHHPAGRPVAGGGPSPPRLSGAARRRRAARPARPLPPQWCYQGYRFARPPPGGPGGRPARIVADTVGGGLPGKAAGGAARPRGGSPPAGGRGRGGASGAPPRGAAGPSPRLARPGRRGSARFAGLPAGAAPPGGFRGTLPGGMPPRHPPRPPPSRAAIAAAPALPGGVDPPGTPPASPPGRRLRARPQRRRPPGRGPGVAGGACPPPPGGVLPWDRRAAAGLVPPPLSARGCAALRPATGGTPASYLGGRGGRALARQALCGRSAPGKTLCAGLRPAWERPCRAGPPPSTLRADGSGPRPSGPVDNSAPVGGKPPEFSTAPSTAPPLAVENSAFIHILSPKLST